MGARKLNVDIGTFSAWAVIDAGGLHVVLTGECDLSALQPLDKLLNDTHELAVEAGVREVTLEMVAVEFMNSSCLAKVLQWVSKMSALPEASRYRIRFKANPRASWQKRSLEAVRCLAADWITIQI